MKNSTRLLLKTYQRLYGPEITMANLERLAGDLSQIAGRERPWTGKFLHSLLKEYRGFSATDQLLEALEILHGRLNGGGEMRARAAEVKIMAVHDLPAGTLVLGQAQRCAAPACPVWFVPTHPRQKYHSKFCARSGRRRRRSQK